MKKIIALVMALILVLSLMTACNNEKFYNIGDRVEIAKNVFMTVNSVRSEKGDGGFLSADEYLVVNLRIRNSSGNDFSFADMVGTYVYDSDGEKYFRGFSSPDGINQIDSDIPAGESVTGDIAFDIPSSVEGLHFTYQDILTERPIATWKLDDYVSNNGSSKTKTYSDTDNLTSSEIGIGAAQPPENLSNDLFSFQFYSEEQFYQLPMSYSDFTACGWALRDYAPNTVLENNCSTNVYYKNGKYEAYIGMFNFSGSDLPLSECMVDRISINDSYWPVSSPIFLPKGIQYGVSGVNDVLTAYGEPYEKNILENITFITYRVDGKISREIEIVIDNETDKIYEITLSNDIKQ